MESSDDDVEKTESPTPNYLKKYKSSGNSPNLHGITAVVSLLSGLAGLWVCWLLYSKKIMVTIAQSLRLVNQKNGDKILLDYALSDSLYAMLLYFSPFFMIVFCVPLIWHACVGEVLCVFSRIKPAFQRCNPFYGMGQLFSMNNLVKLFFLLIKCALIMMVFLYLIKVKIVYLFALSEVDVALGVTQLIHFLFETMVILLSPIVLFSIVEYGYQQWFFLQEVKMTKQAFKEALQEEEGNLQVKKKVKESQLHLYKHNMIDWLGVKNFIITDDEKYAVLLQYQADRHIAPIVVKKWSQSDLKAVGFNTYRIPILIEPGLVKQLFSESIIGKSIPETLYSAVAKALARVEKSYNRENEL